MFYERSLIVIASEIENRNKTFPPLEATDKKYLNSEQTYTYRPMGYPTAT